MRFLENEKLFMFGSGTPTDSINLIPIFEEQWGKDDTEQKLRQIAGDCIKNYNDDLASRTQWEATTADAIKLFMSHRDAKTYPWKDCSNINLPFITIACLQFQARVYDAIINPRGTVGVVNTGSEDKEKAERVRRYMDYQILYQMEDFEDGMDKTLMLLPIVGCAFRKTYYDTTKKRVVSTFIPASDLVVSYTNKVSIDDVERKTHIIYMSDNDCKIRANLGIFSEKAFNLGAAVSYQPSLSRQAIDSAQGITNIPAYSSSMRVLIEQHCLVDFDDDGIAEPYIITIDLTTNEVLRITDRRYIDVNGVVQRMEYFTKYDFFPNPEGFYGIGLGVLLLGINEAGNTIVNAVIDAGTLANLQGGFVSRRSGIKKGNLTFQMGEYKEVDTYAEDLSKALVHLDFKGPNQTLYAVLGLLYEYSKLVSSVSEVMTGQLPASDTPASSVLAVLEEGRKVFSSIHKRIHRAFKQELYKVFKLNSFYLDNAVYFAVLGNEGTPSGEVGFVGRDDFSNNIDVYPVSDPTIISQAEVIMKAEKVYQIGISNPLIANNPQSLAAITKRLLLSLGEHEVASLVQQQPPPPPDLKPEDENAAMLTEQPIQVLPHQDHLHHIKIHDELRDGTFGNELTAPARKLLEQHRLQHISFLYLAYEQMGGDNI